MLPKVQHYVPQFILKNFCSNKQEQIYVFDKQTEKIFSTHIKNVAAENGFYNFKHGEIVFSAEKNLGNLEAASAKLISKINDEETLKNISTTEKIDLSIFITAQIARVKQTRIKLQGINDDLAKVLEKIGADQNKVKGFNLLSEEEIKRTTIVTLVKSVNEFAPYIFDKAWMLFRAPKSTAHFISDNPITMQNRNDFSPYGNLGLAVKGIEIYFPISAKLSLGLFARDIEETLRKNHQSYQKFKQSRASKQIDVPKKAIDQLEKLIDGLESGNAVQSREENVINKNSLQVMQSSRFIYSKNDDFALVQKMIREHPEYKEAPRMVMSNWS